MIENVVNNNSGTRASADMLQSAIDARLAKGPYGPAAITYNGRMVGAIESGPTKKTKIDGIIEFEPAWKEYDAYGELPTAGEYHNFTLLPSGLIQGKSYIETRTLAINVIRQLSEENQRETGAQFDNKGHVIYLAIGERYMFPQAKYASSLKDLPPMTKRTVIHSHPCELSHLPFSSADMIPFVLGRPQFHESIVVGPKGAYVVKGGVFAIDPRTPNNFLEQEYSEIKMYNVEDNTTKWTPPEPEIYLMAMRKHGIVVDYEPKGS